MNEEEKRLAHSRATTKYNEKNVKQLKLNLNRKTDADIIDHLGTIGNVQGYIKELIRRDMDSQ